MTALLTCIYIFEQNIYQIVQLRNAGQSKSVKKIFVFLINTFFISCSSNNKHASDLSPRRCEEEIYHSNGNYSTLRRCITRMKNMAAHATKDFTSNILSHWQMKGNRKGKVIWQTQWKGLTESQFWCSLQDEKIAF